MKHLTVTCCVCGWSVNGPVITSRMETAIREHMEEKRRLALGARRAHSLVSPAAAGSECDGAATEV